MPAPAGEGWRSFHQIRLTEAIDRLLLGPKWLRLVYSYYGYKGFVPEINRPHPADIPEDLLLALLPMMAELSRPDGALIATATRQIGQDIESTPREIPYPFWRHKYGVMIRRDRVEQRTPSGVIPVSFYDPVLSCRMLAKDPPKGGGNNPRQRKLTAQQQMRQCLTQLKIDPSMTKKKQHTLVLKELKVKEGMRGFGYDNFLRLFD